MLPIGFFCFLVTMSYQIADSHSRNTSQSSVSKTQKILNTKPKFPCFSPTHRHLQQVQARNLTTKTKLQVKYIRF